MDGAQRPGDRHLRFTRRVEQYYRDKYGYKPEDLPVASGEYQRLVSLPLNPRMSDADVNDVIEAVNDIAVTFAR